MISNNLSVNYSFLTDRSIDSQSLLEMVNSARKEYGEKLIRNNDFISRVKDELEGETYEIFVGQKTALILKLSI